MTSHSVMPSPISASLNFCRTLRDVQAGTQEWKKDIRTGRPTIIRSGLVSNMEWSKVRLDAEIRVTYKDFVDLEVYDATNMDRYQLSEIDHKALSLAKPTVFGTASNYY